MIPSYAETFFYVKCWGAKAVVWLGIAAGGALGALSRWGVAWLFVSGGFPTATLIVNVTGSFMLGWLYGATSQLRKQSAWYQAAASGFLGAFTTMSTFGMDMWQLIGQERFGLAFFYASVSALGGLFTAVTGLRLGERILAKGEAAVD